MDYCKGIALDYSSLAFGFFGLALAALTTWLAYRERKATLREKVFEKQVEGCLDVVKELALLHEKAWKFSIQHSEDMGKMEVREDFKKHISRRYWRHAIKLSMWMFILPAPVIEAHRGYIAFLKTCITEGGRPDYADCLLKKFTEVIQACRVSLHVEPLSQDTARVVGEFGDMSGNRKN